MKKSPHTTYWFLALAASLLLVSVYGYAGAEVPSTPGELELEARHAELHHEPTDRQLREIERRPWRASKSDLLKSASVSIGSPNRGKLRNGIRLNNSKTLHVKRGSKNSRQGTSELVRLIEFAAAEVARKFPRAELTVGDLSRKRGDRLRPHKSHRSGRDVDLGFYLLNRRGKKVNIHHFVEIKRNGIGRVRKRIFKFDAARNWTLVKALLSHPTIDVQHIFVANSIQRSLLRYASKKRSNRPMIARTKHVMRQMRRGAPHRSHFHVRIFCPEDDKPACKDSPPYYPWHRRPEPAQEPRLERASQ